MRIKNSFTWVVSTAMCLFVGPVGATIYVVDRLEDTPSAGGIGICVDPQDRCSLRAAITAADRNPGTDIIEFSVAGVIQLDSNLGPLPIILETLIIRGQTAPGYAGIDVDIGDAPPRIYLDGINQTTGSGLEFAGTASGGASDSSVTALGVINFNAYAISLVNGAENVRIDACYLGVRSNGTAAGNGSGILVRANDNKIGRRVGFLSVVPPVIGLVGRGNVISGNSMGGVLVFESSGNIIGGNRIGTHVDGTGILGNGYGIRLDNSDNNVVGGFFEDESFGNVVAGNTGNGIDVRGDDNEVYSNLVGVGLPRVVPVSSANGSIGIVVTGDGNIIGSTANLGGNTIADNRSGIVVIGSTNSIVGNFFGLPQQGFRNVLEGILIYAGSGNVIEANNISYNGSHGIELLAASDTTQIKNNIIGVALNSNDDTGNLGDGIRVNGNSNVMTGNLVGRNGMSGIHIFSGSDNIISNNQIGIDSNSAVPQVPMSVGNFFDGIAIGGGTGNGITFNDIAFNRQDGIQIVGETFKTPILQNLISNNDGLGINLGNDGATPNDPGDFDTGPNNLQNFPTITRIVQQGSQIEVRWLVDSVDSETIYPVKAHFFLADSGSSGEGETYLGSGTVTAPSMSEDTILNLPPSAVVGGLVVATATDNNGANNTSEFSPAVGYGELIFRNGFDN